MKLKEFSKLDQREARRLALGTLPKDYRGSFGAKPNTTTTKGK